MRYLVRHDKFQILNITVRLVSKPVQILNLGVCLIINITAIRTEKYVYVSYLGSEFISYEKSIFDFNCANHVFGHHLLLLLLLKGLLWRLLLESLATCPLALLPLGLKYIQIVLINLFALIYGQLFFHTTFLKVVLVSYR